MPAPVHDACPQNDVCGWRRSHPVPGKVYKTRRRPTYPRADRAACGLLLSGMRDPELPDENPIQTEQLFGDVSYPARRSTLIEHARRAGAPSSVRRAIERLPDRSFDSPTALNEALADADHGRRD
jgi:hypothetical protein